MGNNTDIIITSLMMSRKIVLESGIIIEKENIEDLKGAQDPFVYLIHHIHHQAGKGSHKVKDELHHCPLFINKDAKGESFKVEDFRDGDKLYHVVTTEKNETPPEILYDHLGNAYMITDKNLSGVHKWIVVGLKNKKKVRWSDAEV